MSRLLFVGVLFECRSRFVFLALDLYRYDLRAILQNKSVKTKKRLSQAMWFIILFGIVSLFSDMTYEGASSIRGAYLTLLGASAGAIGFASGLGELVGYSMRYLFGRLTDKTRQYWPMTIAGYVLDIIAVPALALVGEHGWVS